MRKNPIWGAMLSLLWPGLGHWYGQSYRIGAWLALSALGWNLGLLALLQVGTISIVLVGAVAALAVIGFAVTIGLAVHAFIIVRRRSDFARPRWFRTAWVTVPVALIVMFGISEAYAVLTAWRAFDIPAGAMVPTLRVGDYIMAETRAYRSRPVKRGDVIVFLNAGPGNLVYVKRVIGLSGDRVQMRAGHLYLNGIEVAREPTGKLVAPDSGIDGPLQQFRFTLPGGLQFDAVKVSDYGLLDNTAEFIVPDKHLFVLGDNLNNSADSRLPDRVGFVPISNLIGRAAIIYWSRDLARIGTRIS